MRRDAEKCAKEPFAVRGRHYIAGAAGRQFFWTLLKPSFVAAVIEPKGVDAERPFRAFSSGR